MIVSDYVAFADANARAVAIRGRVVMPSSDMNVTVIIKVMAVLSCHC